MDENESMRIEIRKAESGIASILRELELATGRTVAGFCLDTKFINTVAGKNRTIREVCIELSNRAGQDWDV